MSSNFISCTTYPEITTKFSSPPSLAPIYEVLGSNFYEVDGESFEKQNQKGREEEVSVEKDMEMSEQPFVCSRLKDDSLCHQDQDGFCFSEQISDEYIYSSSFYLSKISSMHIQHSSNSPSIIPHLSLTKESENESRGRSGSDENKMHCCRTCTKYEVDKKLIEFIKENQELLKMQQTQIQQQQQLEQQPQQQQTISEYNMREMQMEYSGIISILRQKIRIRNVEIIKAIMLFERVLMNHWQCSTSILFRKSLNILFLVCVMISHKSSCDVVYNNKVWSDEFCLDLNMINEFERLTLYLLDFNLECSNREEYTRLHTTLSKIVISPSQFPIAPKQKPKQTIFSSSPSPSSISIPQPQTTLASIPTTQMQVTSYFNFLPPNSFFEYSSVLLSQV